MPHLGIVVLVNSELIDRLRIVYHSSVGVRTRIYDFVFRFVPRPHCPSTGDSCASPPDRRPAASVKRPKLTPADRALGVGLCSFWKDWRSGTHIVQASTVVGWHRQGFRMFWIWKIRRRKPQSADLRNCDDAVIIWCLHYRYERRAA